VELLRIDVVVKCLLCHGLVAFDLTALCRIYGQVEFEGMAYLFTANNAGHEVVGVRGFAGEISEAQRRESRKSNIGYTKFSGESVILAPVVKQKKGFNF